MNWDQVIKSSASTYIDNIFIKKKKMVSAALANYSLICKDPKQLEDKAKVLGLQVWGEDNILWWKWGCEVPNVPQIIAHQSVFSLCGETCGSFPCVDGSVVTAFLKC